MSSFTWPTPPWPQGTGLVEFEAIPSTNDEAMARARAGETGPLWIRADRQTAGRGRRGRAWDSPTGNLMASLLVRPACPAPVAAQMSFVAALAVADALTGVLEAGGADVSFEHKIRLKWPNDVRVDGAKIAGILLESAPAPQTAASAPMGTGQGHTLGPDQVPVDWLITGIGINVARFPDDLPYPATCLGALLAPLSPPEPRDMLAYLGAAMAHWLSVWAEGAGFSRIRSAWLERAEGLGEPVTVRLQSENLEGRFEGLTEDGALIVALAQGGSRVIHGGEVFFPSTQTTQSRRDR